MRETRLEAVVQVRDAGDLNQGFAVETERLGKEIKPQIRGCCSFKYDNTNFKLTLKRSAGERERDILNRKVLYYIG